MSHLLVLTRFFVVYSTQNRSARFFRLACSTQSISVLRSNTRVRLGFALKYTIIEKPLPKVNATDRNVLQSRLSGVKKKY